MSRFSEMVANLCKEHEPKNYLILFGETLYAKVNDKETVSELDLQRYHKIKELAHHLIYCCQKHCSSYKKINELCTRLIPDAEYALREMTMNELMQAATVEYFDALHSAVQQARGDTAWPDALLCLVCGPASPRFGHPAMQYFARLTNKRLEQRRTLCMAKEISYEPETIDLYPNRNLFYVENAHTFEEAKKIGVQLLVEQKVMSKYADMSRDILASHSDEHLKKICKK